MGWQILKWKCACGSSFVKNTWKPLSMKMRREHLIKSKVIKQCFLQKLSENKGMEKLTRLCTSDFPFDHCLLFSVCSISLVASVMLSLYAKLSSHVLTVHVRESSSKCARNSVYLSKIENGSYHQELVSHPMPEHVDELSSFVRTQLLATQVTCGFSFLPLFFYSVAVFIIIDESSAGFQEDLPFVVFIKSTMYSATNNQIRACPAIQGFHPPPYWGLASLAN